MRHFALIHDDAIQGVYVAGTSFTFEAPYDLYDEHGEIAETKIGPITSQAVEGWTYRDWALVEVFSAPPAPDPYEQVVNSSVELVDGVPTRIYEYGPAPWPTLSNRQFWKALALTEMHADVLAVVDLLPLEDQIEAKQAQDYQPDHWLITETRPAFELDDEQFRDLWFWAATL